MADDPRLRLRHLQRQVDLLNRNGDALEGENESLKAQLAEALRAGADSQEVEPLKAELASVRKELAAKEAELAYLRPQLARALLPGDAADSVREERDEAQRAAAAKDKEIEQRDEALRAKDEEIEAVCEELDEARAEVASLRKEAAALRAQRDVESEADDEVSLPAPPAPPPPPPAEARPPTEPPKKKRKGAQEKTPCWVRKPDDTWRWFESCKKAAEFYDELTPKNVSALVRVPAYRPKTGKLVGWEAKLGPAAE